MKKARAPDCGARAFFMQQPESVSRTYLVNDRPLAFMTRVVGVVAVLVNVRDPYDVAGVLVAGLGDRAGHDDRDDVTDVRRRIRAVARERLPRRAAGAVDQHGEALEAGDAVGDRAAHLVVLPPLRAPEVLMVAHAVIGDVAH